MIYFCCDSGRRARIEALNAQGVDINGIDFLEVDELQTTLTVHFVVPLLPGRLTAQNVRIEGGERITNVGVVSVVEGAGSSFGDPKVLIVTVDGPGDFSVYTLRLVQGGGMHPDDPPPGFDPATSAIDFEFKAACESDFDCKKTSVCPPEPLPEPAIDYVAKDYASFRQLMLDRMAVLLPGWTERHAADLGVMLVELLAYAGDYLSYEQDAIATEAYLGTARRRISVRRHARLVDYPMHEGLNARTWVHLEVNQDHTISADDHGARTQFLTSGAATLPLVIRHDDRRVADAIDAGATVFEMLDPNADLFLDHNEMRFHTWDGVQCCLPRGATCADLAGKLPNLVGRIVVFAEVKGPESGSVRDADPAHRYAVRVIDAKVIHDPVDDVDVTRIEWAADDALPFPLCISSKIEQHVIDDVSVAWGNIVLADHGRTRTGIRLGPVPPGNAALIVHEERDRCTQAPQDPPPPRFAPVLPDRNLTFAAPYDATLPASASLESEPRLVVPDRMKLFEEGSASTTPWQPREDLLNASDSDREFVAEVESDGTARLRFGDGTAGMRPGSGVAFIATYRVGNGVAGNIGAESIAALVNDDADGIVTKVTNPLPARGGVDPESIERVRQNAPEAFRVQERAVTAADYARSAERCDKGVQRAAATFRWTGSWLTVFVTVDRKGGRDAGEPAFKAKMRRCLDRFRMAGHDLHFDAPQFVSLDIALDICVKAEYFRADVEAAVRDVLSNRALPDGTLGFFHPDRFTFAQRLYLSPLLAAVQSVQGVDFVRARTFGRQGEPGGSGIADGFLDFGPLEIARLDNDPNFREHGVLALNVDGGR